MKAAGEKRTSSFSIVSLFSGCKKSEAGSLDKARGRRKMFFKF
jgi:hypothetical protein